MRTAGKQSGKQADSLDSDRLIDGNDEGACEHCGGLVYGDTIRCAQCGRFPIRMHQCPRCKSIAAATADRCWKCGRTFSPEGDYL